MANIKVAVLNASSVVNNADVPPVVTALQQQVHEDFAPVWGVDADLRIIASPNDLAVGEWLLAILDNSDQAGALGYHDLTDDGDPIGKVFAATDLQFGDQWSVTASHELLEMLADPNINLTVFEEDDNGGRLYAYEVCDACEADELAYARNNVKVSDFVYPTWFESFREPNSAQFDFTQQISEPFQLLPGGYIGYYDVTSGTGWQQLTAQKNDFRSRGPVGSRRERRSVPMPKRIKSTYKLSGRRAR